MNAGHKHFSRWSFGDIVWHRMTGERAMIIGIGLRKDSPASYSLVFEEGREGTCYEMELTEIKPAFMEEAKP